MIYITTFERQKTLIKLLEQYGYKYYTYKITTKKNNTKEKELIYVKNLKNKILKKVRKNKYV